jgi:hypothetical protein
MDMILVFGLLLISLAIKYLKLRSESRDKATAMTLANKISCKDPVHRINTRSDGYQVLYKSQMKNNDKGFDMVIDRLKKNIPDKETEKYALRRIKSTQFFNDHKEIPDTRPPENLYIDDIDIPDDLTDVGKLSLQKVTKSASAQHVNSSQFYQFRLN